MCFNYKFESRGVLRDPINLAFDFNDTQIAPDVVWTSFLGPNVPDRNGMFQRRPKDVAIPNRNAPEWDVVVTSKRGRGPEWRDQRTKRQLVLMKTELEMMVSSKKKTVIITHKG